VEVGILEKIGILENGILLDCGGRKRKKIGKGKENGKGNYSLGREDESGGFPGFSCRCGNLSGKYRNRPKFKYLGTTRNKYQKSRIIY